MNTFRAVNVTCQKPFGVFALFIVASLIFSPFIVAQAAVNPLLPIGSVKLAGASSIYADLDKMGLNDAVLFDIKDSQGKGYLDNDRIEYRNGTWITYSVRGSFDIRIGNGQIISDIPYGLVGTAETRFMIEASYIRQKPVCSGDSGECLAQRRDPLTDPLVPGPVYLTKVEFSLIDPETQEVVQRQSTSPNLKLFTVASPPTISINNSSVLVNGTYVLSGANFDIHNTKPDLQRKDALEPYNAAAWRGNNRIFFDLDRSAGAITARGDSSRLSRVINRAGNDDDLVHYCSAGRLKFDMPTFVTYPDLDATHYKAGQERPMPLGRHTLTLLNDYGYSNTIEINVVAGTGSPDNDPACSSPYGTITSIEPTSGPVGTMLTINGTNFGTENNPYRGGILSFNTVLINGVNAKVLGFKYEKYTNSVGFPGYRATQLQVCVPEGATSGKIKVIPDTRYGILGPTFKVTSGQGDCNAQANPTPTGTSLVACGVTQASLNAGSARRMVISGNYAYLAVDNKLTIVDISDPKNPIQRGSVDVGSYSLGPGNSNPDGSQKYFTSPPDYPRGIFVVGSTAYVRDSYGINVVDATSPANPRLTKQIPLGGNTSSGTSADIIVNGKYAYVATSDYLLSVDLDASRVVESWPAVEFLSRSGTYGYFVRAGASPALSRWQFRSDGKFSAPEQLYSKVGWTGKDIAISGNYLYAADQFTVLDLNQKETFGNLPAGYKVAATDTSLAGQFIAVANNKAYVALGNILKIIDIADPSKPQLIKSVTLSGNVSSLSATGDYVYVFAGNSFSVLNVSSCQLAYAGGGEDGSAGGGVASITRAVPEVLHPGNNLLGLVGTGLGNSPMIAFDKAGIAVQDVSVNGDGTLLLARIEVVPGVTGSVGILLDGQPAHVSVTIALLDANAPVAESSSVDSTELGRARIKISGKNLKDIQSVEILGLPNVFVDNFEVKSDTEIYVNLTVLDFNPNIFGFIRRAFAQTKDACAAALTAANGDKTVLSLSCQKLLGASSSTPGSGNTAASSKISATGFENICSRSGGLANCVQQIYLFSLGLGSVVALLMIVLAGYRYMTAEGNAERVASAKDAFSSAFIGLIIIFIAFILLYLINPDLTQFQTKNLELPPIDVKKQ